MENSDRTFKCHTGSYTMLTVGPDQCCWCPVFVLSVCMCARAIDHLFSGWERDSEREWCAFAISLPISENFTRQKPIAAHGTSMTISISQTSTEIEITSMEGWTSGHIVYRYTTIRHEPCATNSNHQYIVSRSFSHSLDLFHFVCTKYSRFRCTQL